jgi:hypothetical protein
MSNSGKSPNGILLDGVCIIFGVAASLYLPRFVEFAFSQNDIAVLAYGILGSSVISTAYLWWQKRKNNEFGKFPYGVAMVSYGLIMGIFFVTR